MLRVNELQIGDYVTVNKGFPMYVEGYYMDVAYLNFDGNEGDVWEYKEEEMSPIPITEELLEKALSFGCNQQGGSYCWEYNIGNCYYLSIHHVWYSKDEWYIRISDGSFETVGSFKFKYLHQLQNGIRLITDSELEVRL